jgi:hypothetical protein
MTKLVDFLKDIFRPDPAVGVSRFRIYLLRFIFFGNFFFLGLMDSWRVLFSHRGPWDPLQAVAYSFWAAYSTLMLLGLRYPLKMVPLLLLQFFYKLVWLVVVSYPLWASHQLQGSSAEKTTTIFVMAVLVDPFLIPWAYVLKSYILKTKEK